MSEPIDYDVVTDAWYSNNLEFPMLEVHLDNKILNLVGNRGDNTFLHFAVRKGKMNVLKWLVGKGVTLEPLNGNRETPLDLAYANKHYKIIRYLGSLGLDLNSYNKNGLTMVQQAFSMGDLDGYMELSQIPGIETSKLSQSGNPTSYFLLTNDNNLSNSKKSSFVEKLIKTDFDFQLDQGRNLQILEMLINLITNSFRQPKAESIILSIFKKSSQAWLLNRDTNGRNLLMQWVLQSRFSTFIGTKIILKSSLYDLSDVDDDGNNILQIVMKYRSARFSGLLEFIAENKKFHSLIDTEIFSEAVKLFGERIIGTLLSYSFDFKSLIIDNPKFGCCDFLNWSIEHKFPALVKIMLENDQLNAIDLLNQHCPGKKKLEQIVVKGSGCACGKCVGPRYKTVERKIPGHQPTFWSIFKIGLSGNWPDILELAADILVKFGIDHQSLKLPQEYQSSKSFLYNGKIKENFNVLIKRNLLNTNIITQGDPRNIYLFDQPDRKQICLNDKLNINNHELILHESIEDIPAENFILLSNGIAWDSDNLYDFIISRQGSNSFTAIDKLFSPVFQGPIWSDFDLKNFKNHPKLNKLNKFLDISNEIRLVANSLELMRRFRSIFMAEGEEFEARLNPLLNDAEKEKWIPFLRSKIKNFSGYSMPKDLDPEISLKIEKLKQEALFEFHQFWKSLNEAQIRAWSKIIGNIFLKRINSVLRLDGYNYNSEDSDDETNACVMVFGRTLHRGIVRVEQMIELFKINLEEIEEGEKEEENNDHFKVSKPRILSKSF